MIGSHIRDYRREKKMSQFDLGQAMGIDQTLISRIERDRRKVTADELTKFAYVLGVTIEELLNSKEVTK